MMYINGVDNGRCTVVDSESGGSFDVFASNIGEFYCMNKPFNMVPVLGYLGDGIVTAVPRHLLSFLGCIESIAFTSSNKVFGRVIMVSWRWMAKASPYNIFCRSNEVYSVLDMVMCASYKQGFEKELDSGVLNLCFGTLRDAPCFVVRFCGDYLGMVAKLVVLYRDSAEFQQKLRGSFLK